MSDHDLFLGTRLADGTPATLDMDHLTTHAVCLGMTGSGKTGLGIVALEELARRGVPLLVIDLKGDMV
ncbi:MAG: ATP-binding protein, partial [Thermoanaerobaculales bacterium]|nr:ATP-binding protein [Thermoanaerobaculales bacterium]